MATSAHAQVGGLIIERPSQQRLPLPKFEEPQSPLLPPVAAPAEREPNTLPGAPQVFVKQYKLTGNTVFSNAELAEITAPYTNREITFEELEAVRYALTLHYVQHGYINSGALVPDQTVRDGVIEIQIVEGRLSNIEIAGNRWFRSRYLRDRLTLYGGPPLKLQEMEEGLQLLQQNPLIKRLNAELRPDLARGEAILKVHVDEQVPYRLGLEFNNYESPSVGSEQGVITAAHDNLTGNNDLLFARYGITGGVGDIDTNYIRPLNAGDTTLGLEFRRSNTDIVEGADFSRLDITSKTYTYGATLRQPLLRTLGAELTAALIFQYRRSQTYLLGEPFAFQEGTDNGKAVVTVLRLVAPEWVWRSAVQVLACRSQFSFGLDALGATVNSGPVPSGRFFAWLGQFQWARRLGVLDAESVVRADIQLTPNRLFGLEQFSLGGAHSVRGYRENLLVRDNGTAGSVEIRIPVLRNRPGIDLLQLAPFFDAGTGWAEHAPTVDPKYLLGIGIGLRWAIAPNIDAQLYYGYKIKDVTTPGGDPQDVALHFQLASTFTLPEAMADWLPPWHERQSTAGP
jgi:hemolysin activation/secretion protein